MWIVDGTCDPESVAFTWTGELHEAVFRIRYDGPAGTARGGVRVFARDAVIGHLDLVMPVDASIDPYIGGEEAGRRLFASRHRRILASYAREDSAIVRHLKSIVHALGDDYIIDVDQLRAGDDWQTELDRLIRDADAFQLFWSAQSMESPNVRHEWEVALSLHREGFIIPVYWQETPS